MSIECSDSGIAELRSAAFGPELKPKGDFGVSSNRLSSSKSVERSRRSQLGSGSAEKEGLGFQDQKAELELGDP
jgi:hypothetical protein